MNDYYEETYSEIDELEAERRMLVNEELSERIKVEKRLNTIAGFVAFSMFARIGIIILALIIIIFGFLKIHI